MAAPLAILNGELVAGEYRLDDGRWALLGDGIQPKPSYIDAVLVDGSTLYVTGYTQSGPGVGPSFVAKWDGEDWTLLASGIATYRAIALVRFGGELYAAGLFEEIGGTVAKNVARWDGAAWHAVGAGVPDEVNALAVLDGVLYAGGERGDSSDEDDGPLHGMLARWDGNTWTQVGAAVNGPIHSLLAMDGVLYVGGCFNTVGSDTGIEASHIARWDGGAWSALGVGVGSDAPCGRGGRSGTTRDTVMAIVPYENGLVVSGSFDESGGVETRNIARWDGQQWSRFGDGYNSWVAWLAAKDGDLFAAGYYADVIDGAAIPGVARWNGTSWQAVAEAGPTVSSLYTLESQDGDLYAGGIFDTAGGTEIHSIAKWDGIRWLPVGDYLDGYVLDIAAIGETVYVAGELRTSPEDVLAPHVARWNGKSWKMIDDDSAYYSSIEAFDGELYAAADPPSGGAILDKWNGQTWKRIAEFADGYIRQLEAGDKLYVSGSLGMIGDEYPDVASWDGSHWTALPELNGWVDALAWSGLTLFAGGNFHLSDNFSVQHSVAKWDGEKWMPIARNADSGFGAFTAAAYGNNVVVVANGLLIGGEPYSGLARWNGTKWQAVGGMLAERLAFVGEKLYVGGWLPEGAGNNRETIGLYALGACGNGVLDAGEDCDPNVDGTDACCNVNSCHYAAAGTTCRSSRGPCDKAETCNGTSSTCPSDKVRPAGFACREAKDGCHDPGVCDGDGLTCSIDSIAPCSDGSFCNGIETCELGGACQSGVLVDCDDGNDCTIDFCAEGNEQCRHGLPAGPGCSQCGDVDYYDGITVLDALLALRGAVGLGECPPFPCDFDGSGKVTTADALKILQVAVGSLLESACPGDVD